MMQSIYDALKVFQQSVWRAVYLTEEDRQTLCQHHRAVFEAIKERDPERARDAMLTHLTFAEQRSSAYVFRNSE
jgi:GntR family transcriptional repressor for pyruvate dehydrogenase complex